MNMKQFIRQNRSEIDMYIKESCDNCKLNDEEREMWIRNDEGLYNFAKRYGVRL